MRVKPPPRRSARWRRLARPLRRSVSPMPSPSSCTSTLTRCGVAVTRTSTERAWACARHVGQALPQHRDQITDDVAGQGVLQQAREADRGLEPEGDHGVGDHLEQLAAHPRRGGLRSVVELEDAGADLADGVVEIDDRLVDPIGDPAGPGQARDALQAQAGREEPLDDVIVQIGGDPVTLVEHRGPALLGAGLGQLDGHRGLGGEPGRHVHLVRGERGPPGAPGRGQHAQRALRPGQRDDHHRSDVQLAGARRRRALQFVGRRDAQRLTGGEHPTRQRARDRHPPDVGHRRRAVPHRDLHPQVRDCPGAGARP